MFEPILVSMIRPLNQIIGRPEISIYTTAARHTPWNDEENVDSISFDVKIHEDVGAELEELIHLNH